MPAIAAILDACVLFPASLRDTLLRAADAGLYRALWSDDILDEVQRNLISDRGLTAEQAQGLITTIRTYFPELVVTRYTPLIAAMTNHPKDRHVLAAAVVAGAEIIVTSNLKDFPQSALTPYHVVTQSPDTFLVGLFDLDQERVIQLVTEQAGDLHNPPMTVDELLNVLVIHAPTFIRRVRSALSQ